MKIKKSLKNQYKTISIKNIHRRIFITQLVLIVTLALFLGVSGTLINIHFEVEKRDQNLQNIAEAVASSPLIDDKIANPDDKKTTELLNEYLDSLKISLDNIDVISFVSRENIRLYHSNHELIGTEYDGAIPEFEKVSKEYYTSNETGPSGSQRRAYAAVYDKNGNYTGFVMTILLLENIKAETLQILFIFALITIAAILIELIISAELSSSIKKSLHGYEPNVFSAMFQVRDNILESLNEGVLAVDKNGVVQFANRSAAKMLGKKKAKELINTPFTDCCNDGFIKNVISTGEKEFNIQEQSIDNSNVLIDCIPIKEKDDIIGAVAILHNREEYTKLMEDLAGTRYLVDSMRANNHDFTNKLHVIMGLIQMEMYDDAVSYIENISIVQRETISKIMSVVDEPSIAALLIGKSARASELNIKFILNDESHYSKTDLLLPSELMVTVIGNLIDNAFEAINIKDIQRQKELRFGIYSRENALLITVEDTGIGISKDNLEHIYDNGFSTKGEGRGTGLYQVKEMVEAIGGKITVESQENVGTSFTVIFQNKS
ncbi:MAG: PAS domain-containing protein [Ruminococcaceae bacterium]|nr:PAS domain-containing protein [Oscillospiraceae bacterium]MBQ8765675.1 Spo0B domain-containing protein [Clostridia bacterium]MBR2921941.1 Spo0B domain-containing protein [Alphaproteobacteria bacterium]MBR3919853.1 Spo0B domain-containing protein [Clostridia bacterium]